MRESVVSAIFMACVLFAAYMSERQDQLAGKTFTCTEGSGWGQKKWACTREEWQAQQKKEQK
jgi:hypothetical protein